MGRVYQATQLAVDRLVAVKILPSAMTANRAYIERFLQEVRLLGKLEHPNIVTVFDAGEDGGCYYLAMSYVDGETIDQRLKRAGPFAEREALRIARIVARALDYAWEQHQVFHRDLKPAKSCWISAWPKARPRTSV